MDQSGTDRPVLQCEVNMNTKNVFIVQNCQDFKLLTEGGGWSRPPTNHKIAKFATEQDAEAAFPSGIHCRVLSKPEPVK